MLPFPLGQVLVTILVAGASLLLMNMAVHFMEMFLVFINKTSLIMRKSRLIRPNTGVIWRKRKKWRMNQKKWRRRNLKLVFSLLIVCPALPLEWRHLMLLTFVSCKGRNLKSLFIRLIYLEVKSQIKWMSLYCQKSWMPRKMFYPQSMKKQGRKGSYEISVRISVTWWQRMRRGRRERCKKRRASPRGIRNLSSKGGFMPFSFVEKNGGHGSYPFIKLSFSTKGGLVVSFVVWHFYHTLLSASSFHCFLLGTYYS